MDLIPDDHLCVDESRKSERLEDARSQKKSASSPGTSASRASSFHNQDDQGKRCLKLANELLISEKLYLSDLLFIHEQLYQPLREASLIPEEHLKILFPSTMKAIFNIHINLLQALQKRSTDPNMYGNLGEFFVRLIGFKGELLDLYSKYVTEFPACLTTLNQYIFNSPNFVQFIQDRMQLYHHTDSGVMKFFLAPLQRMPYYFRVLTELLRNTDSNHSDRLYFENCLRHLTDFMTFVHSFAAEETTSHGLDESIDRESSSLRTSKMDVSTIGKKVSIKGRNVKRRHSVDSQLSPDEVFNLLSVKNRGKMSFSIQQKMQPSLVSVGELQLNNNHHMQNSRDTVRYVPPSHSPLLAQEYEVEIQGPPTLLLNLNAMKADKSTTDLQENHTDNAHSFVDEVVNCCNSSSSDNRHTNNTSYLNKITTPNLPDIFKDHPSHRSFTSDVEATSGNVSQECNLSEKAVGKCENLNSKISVNYFKTNLGAARTPSFAVYGDRDLKGDTVAYIPTAIEKAFGGNDLGVYRWRQEENQTNEESEVEESSTEESTPEEEEDNLTPLNCPMYSNLLEDSWSKQLQIAEQSIEGCSYKPQDYSNISRSRPTHDALVHDEFMSVNNKSKLETAEMSSSSLLHTELRSYSITSRDAARGCELRPKSKTTPATEDLSLDLVTVEPLFTRNIRIDNDRQSCKARNTHAPDKKNTLKEVLRGLWTNKRTSPSPRPPHQSEDLTRHGESAERQSDLAGMTLASTFKDEAGENCSAV